MAAMNEMMDKTGLLTVISGFSGVGKGTLVKKLLERYPEDYALSVSATTRAPRPGEEHGREYFFISRRSFKSLIRRGKLYEHAEYNGNFYGTPMEPVDRMLSEGKNVILEIEVQGGLQIKERFPDTFLLFIVPPDAATLKARLTGRGTETAEQIRGRLLRAVEEAAVIPRYDDILVNGDLDTAVEELHRMITEGLRSGTDLPELSLKLETELKTLTEED